MTESVNVQQKDMTFLTSENLEQMEKNNLPYLEHNHPAIMINLPPISAWRQGLRLFCESDEPPLILVDMDNTLVDWELQFEKLMKLHHPQINIVPPPRRKEFKIELNYEDEHRGPILHLTSLNEFWLSMEPISGAIEAINDMVSMGLVVFIVTTPDTKHTARSSFEKISWVEKHLGVEWKYKTILTHDKTLVKGDILIDDRPAASVGLLKPSWTHALFAQPYNANHTDCPRLESWNDWGPMIYKILLEREKHMFDSSLLVGNKHMNNASDEIRHQSSRRSKTSDANSLSDIGSAVSQINSQSFTCCHVSSQIRNPIRHSINFSRLQLNQTEP